MSTISFNFADNLNSPIIISDIDGKVIYKNHSAKRCVKSPRIAANINKYINKKAPEVNNSSDRIRIVTINNYGAIHKRAFVCRVIDGNDEMDIWFFGSSLQITDISGLEAFNLKKLEKCLDNIIETLKTLDFQANKSSIDRYMQIGIPFLEAMRNMRYSVDNEYKFRAHQILESIKNKIYDLAHIYSLRVEIETDAVDPGNFYHISFETLSTLFVQLLLTMLKVSHFSPVTVNCSQQAEYLNIKAVAPIKLLKNIPRNGSILFELASAFPDEYFNILFLEQYALMNDYKIKYKITEGNSVQMLEIEFLTSLDTEKYILNTDNPMANTIVFSELEKRIHAQLDAVFNALHKKTP